MVYVLLALHTGFLNGEMNVSQLDAMLTHDWGITGENHVKVSGRPRNICFLPLCLMPGSAIACVISTIYIEDGAQLE